MYRPEIQRAADNLRAMGMELPPPRIDAVGMEMRRHYMGVSLTWTDLGNEEPEDDDVIAGFRELNAEAVISELFILSWLLETARPSANTAPVQGAIADWLLPPQHTGEARARLASTDLDYRREAVVHAEQLGVAAALALLYGRPGSPDPGQPRVEMRHALGPLLLMISSRLGTHGRAAPESDAILGSTVRMAHMAYNEPPALVAARNFEILIEDAQRAHADGRLQYDLERDFVNAYGVTPLEFTGIGMLHALPFMNIDKIAPTPGAYWEAGRGLVAELTRLGLEGKLQHSLVADRAWFAEQLHTFAR